MIFPLVYSILVDVPAVYIFFVFILLCVLCPNSRQTSSPARGREENSGIAMMLLVIQPRIFSFISYRGRYCCSVSSLFFLRWLFLPPTKAKTTFFHALLSLLVMMRPVYYSSWFSRSALRLRGRRVSTERENKILFSIYTYHASIFFSF